MHTDYVRDGKKWIVIIHNGDWSGDAILRWGSGDTVDGEVTIPGYVAKELYED